MGSQKKRNRLRKGIKCSAIKNHLMFKKIVWITISIIAAISLSVVVGIINPSEKVNALWLVVASGCFYEPVAQIQQRQFENICATDYLLLKA
jgi:hypothetical protein